MRFSMFVALAALLAVTTPVRAEDDAAENPNQMSSQVLIGVNASVNLLSSFYGNGPTSDSRIGFGGGGEVKYFFSPHVGVSAGLEIAKRGYNLVGGGSDTVWFLDIPFGLSFRYSGTMFAGAGGFSYFDLGGFVPVALGDFKTLGLQSKTGFGLRIAGGTAFPVSPGFRLGFGSTFKFGLANSVNAPSQNKIFEVGLMLLAFFG